MIMKRILFAFIALVLAVASAQALTTAQRADSAYNAENYRLAIDLYRQALAHDGASANVYYNLGNAYYRIDKLGSAVANYERVLRLDPTDADARQNLEFVKSRIQDRPEDDTAFLASLHHSMVQSMTANAWAWTAFVIFLLFMGAVALYIFATGVGLRKAGFFGGIVLLVMLAYSLCAASDAVERATAHSRAVVIVPSTQLSSAPRASRSAADKVVSLHEGTVVEVIDSVATPDDPQSPMWYNVKINNSTKAWLRSADVERI